MDDSSAIGKNIYLVDSETEKEVYSVRKEYCL